MCIVKVVFYLRCRDSKNNTIEEYYGPFNHWCEAEDWAKKYHTYNEYKIIEIKEP